MASRRDYVRPKRVKNIAFADSPYTVDSQADETILVDTSAGAVVVTLPPTPADCTVIRVKKITTDANSLTIGRNGQNIDGVAADLVTTQVTLPSAELHYDLTTTNWALMSDAPSITATPGTSTAFRALVGDTNKAIDSVRAKTEQTIGGTGVPGGAAVQQCITKAQAGFADTVATAMFTVTVPNAAHAAVIELDLLASLGAGGAIGAGEATRNVKYQVTLVRTAGVACVAAVSAAIGGAAANVAGAANVTSVVVTASAMTGGVGVTQTFTINVAITKSGGASANHTCVGTAYTLNQNATGVTIV